MSLSSSALYVFCVELRGPIHRVSAGQPGGRPFEPCKVHSVARARSLHSEIELVRVAQRGLVAQHLGHADVSAGATKALACGSCLDGILLSVEVASTQLVVLMLLQQTEALALVPAHSPCKASAESMERLGQPTPRSRRPLKPPDYTVAWQAAQGTHGCARSLCVLRLTALRKEELIAVKESQ